MPQGNAELLSSGVYTSACLTQIHCHRLASEVSLITSSTDGHIATWPISDLLAEKGISSSDRGLCLSDYKTAVTGSHSLHWNSRHRIHQSTIKCMSLLRLSKDRVIIATGGDDNAIALTSISPRTDTTHTVRFSTLLIPRAHAAAITAVRYLTSHGDAPGSFLILSTGNDQRLKSWRVRVVDESSGAEGIEVEKASNESSAIADASCMEILSESGLVTMRVVVAGIGMEMWDIV